MTSLHRPLRVVACLIAALAVSVAITVPQNINAQTPFLWTAGSGSDTNWSTPANWSPTGTPGALDTATFGSLATSGGPTTVNNALTANVTVSTLNYTNTTTGAWHVTDIPANITLRATNVTMGGFTGNFITDVAMTDAGTFIVNGNLSIGDVATANSISVVNLSTLGNFIFNNSSGTFTVGPVTPNDGLGNLTLAETNTITASSLNYNTNDTGSSSTTPFTLGSGTNNFAVGTFNIAAGRNTTTVSLPSGSGLRIRGSGGTDASLATMTLGYHNTSGSGSHSTANLNFNGSPVDIRLGNVILGRSDHTPTTASSFGQGTIAFDTGTLYASNILMATTVGSATSAGQYFSQGIGSITVGASGTLYIGSGGMIMVDQTNNATSFAGSSGGLTINSGSVICSNNISKVNTAGIAGITNNGGTLTMVSGTVGTPAIPIDNMVISEGTLHLNVSGTATTPIINLTTLAASGGTTITIDSVANVSTPVIVHLIGYNPSSGDQFAGFSLSPLPGGFSGSLVDNSGLIDLSIAPAGSSITSVRWIGAVGSTPNSSWDLSTHNWLDTNSNPIAYANPDFAHFDDTASNSTVTLTTTNLTPSSFTFTNNGVANGGLDYTLNGSGAIEGLVGLFKDLAGTVTLTETGGDNFTGGVNVNAGTVVLDNANSAITGGFVINGGATLQVGNNDANGNVPAGSMLDNGTLIVNQTSSEQITNFISGSGALVKQGNGTLTLANTNSYSGNTTVSGGTLALSGVGTISNSASVTVNNATLDISGAAKTSLLASLSTSGGQLTMSVTNSTLPLIMGGSWSMGGTTNHVNFANLPPIAVYPTTIAIVQCASGVSGFNLGLGTVPAGSPPFAGNVTLSQDGTTILLTLTTGPIGVRSSVLWIGTNNVSATTNWSDNLNWQLPGAPTAADNVVFSPISSASDTPFGSVGDGFDGIVNPGNINNFVNVSSSIGSLLYTNVGGSAASQNTFIANGAVLNVLSNGSLTVGSTLTTVDFGSGAKQFVTIGGANGTLQITNPAGTVYVGLGNASSGTELATLDLSGLGFANLNVSRFLIGVGSGAEAIALGRVAGTAYLARTNVIVAGISVTNTEGSDTISNAVAFDVGEDDGNPGMSCFLYLGQTNGIFADAIGTGRQKSVASMLFNPSLITDNLHPSAYFRGASTNPVTVWSVGDGVVNSGSGENASGTNDFTGGHVDALVTSMFVGRASSATAGTGTNTGTLTFDNGIFNVGTMFVGLQPTNTTKVGAGTVNVETNTTLGTFATLAVSGTLNLGITATGGTAATGNVNIDGGALTAGSVACGGNNSITLGASGNGGVLMASNSLGATGAALNALTLNGNTLLALPANNTAAAVVTTLTIDGQPTTTNKLNILSVAGAITPPVELPVIQYGTLVNSGGSFNLGLGTLPAGYSGVFTNDTTHSTIGVIITAAPVSGPTTNATITKVSLVGTNLVIHGTNNNVPNTSFHYAVLASTNLLTPLGSWTVLSTNPFSGTGTFDYTNPIVSGTPRQFLDVEAVP